MTCYMTFSTTTLLLLVVVLYADAQVNTPCQFTTHDARGQIKYDFAQLSGRGAGPNGLWLSRGRRGDFYYDFCDGAVVDNDVCTHETAVCQFVNDTYYSCGTKDNFVWQIRTDDPRAGAVVVYYDGSTSPDCQTTSGRREIWVSFECDPKVFTRNLLCCVNLVSGLQPNVQPGCQLPLSPEHGEMSCTQGSQIGSVCAFACDEGYMMEGAYIATCQETGTWDYKPPKCTRATPDGVSPILSGLISFFVGLAVGGIAVYILSAQQNKSYKRLGAGETTRLVRDRGTF